MNFFNTVYDRPCNYIQSFLDLHVPEISEDFVKAAARNFAYSFTVSLLLAKGNSLSIGDSVISGLTAGALAFLATTIHVTFMTLFRNLNVYASTSLNKPLEPLGFEVQHCARMLGLFTAGYLGEALGKNFKNATLFATLPFWLWNLNNHDETPTIGIIV